MAPLSIEQIDLALRLGDRTIGDISVGIPDSLSGVAQSIALADEDSQSTVTVEQIHPIRSAAIQQWLWQHRISLSVAQSYCREAWYSREARLFSALAFPNDAGGFELVDGYRRLRALPSAHTLITNQFLSIAVFRHFLDLLSFATIIHEPTSHFPAILVLNGPLKYPSVRSVLQPYRFRHLFLPNDPATTAFVAQAKSDGQKCIDHRPLYYGYPSLHDWTCHIGSPKLKLANAGNLAR